MINYNILDKTINAESEIITFAQLGVFIKMLNFVLDGTNMKFAFIIEQIFLQKICDLNTNCKEILIFVNFLSQSTHLNFLPGISRNWIFLHSVTNR